MSIVDEIAQGAQNTLAQTHGGVGSPWEAYTAGQELANKQQSLQIEHMNAQTNLDRVNQEWGSRADQSLQRAYEMAANGADPKQVQMGLKAWQFYNSKLGQGYEQKPGGPSIDDQLQDMAKNLTIDPSLTKKIAMIKTFQATAKPGQEIPANIKSALSDVEDSSGYALHNRRQEIEQFFQEMNKEKLKTDLFQAKESQGSSKDLNKELDFVDKKKLEFDEQYNNMYASLKTGNIKDFKTRLGTWVRLVEGAKGPMNQYKVQLADPSDLQVKVEELLGKVKNPYDPKYAPVISQNLMRILQDSKHAHDAAFTNYYSQKLQDGMNSDSPGDRMTYKPGGGNYKRLTQRMQDIQGGGGGLQSQSKPESQSQAASKDQGPKKVPSPALIDGLKQKMGNNLDAVRQYLSQKNFDPSGVK